MSANKRIPSPIAVIVNQSILDIFHSYKQDHNQNEACGILIGTHSIDELKITITFATEPDCNDKRSRFSFKIKSNRHNKTLQNRFSKSGNREVYLGTWHTHPEDHPNPSKCETDDWLKQYSINRGLFESMLFVIVGIKTTKWFFVNDNGIYVLDSNVIYNENEVIV
jgi:integrative and conjugative element protein (TIGR02256 family)